MNAVTIGNAWAVTATLMADAGARAGWDRGVSFAVGTIEADGSQQLAAGLMLTAAEAQALAADLIAAAQAVDSGADLPVCVSADAPAAGRA